MKRFMTALGVCALLATPIEAYAGNFLWDGGDLFSTSWKAADNWTADSSYPGELSSSDTATIDETTDTAAFTVSVTSALSNSIVDLTMRDGADGTRVILSVGDGSAPADATFILVTGTFSVAERSGQSGSYVEVQGDDSIDVSGTFQVVGGSSTAVTLEYTGTGMILTVS